MGQLVLCVLAERLWPERQVSSHKLSKSVDTSELHFKDRGETYDSLSNRRRDDIRRLRRDNLNG